MSRFTLFRLPLLCLLALPFAHSVASAHFLWLLPPDEGSREFSVVFSERMEPGEPEFLERFVAAQALLHGPEGTRRKVALQLADDRLVGKIPDGFDAVAVEVRFTWGVFSRGDSPFLLRYRAIGVVDRDRFGSISLDCRAPGPLLDLSAKEEGVGLHVTTGQRPLKMAEVHVFGPKDSHLETDKTGHALWRPARPGLYGLMTKAVKEKEGQWEGEDYPQIRNYTTLTLEIDEAYAAASDSPAADLGQKDFPDLPLPLTSFGAARLGDAIYVYGGHMGSAHSYSTAEQSNQLLRLDLQDLQSGWQRVSEGPRMQGLALVAHGDSLIRIGGFTARNEEGEEHDLHSQSTVAAYDPASGRWTSLPDLPEPRSSFDAAVIDDHLYVVGGWALDDPHDNQWHQTAWVLDLAAESPHWESLPQPPFQRRALAVAAHAGKLYVIGGMQPEGGPTTETAVYDPATLRWTEGPALLGPPMSGFGAAAISHDGRLVVSTVEGDLQQLAADGTSWRRIGETEDAKFFHRLVPLDQHRLLSIGGANMSIGKFQQLEVIDLNSRN